MTAQELRHQLRLLLTASHDVLNSLHRGQLPSDELMERRGQLLRAIAEAIILVPDGDYSAELRELAGMDAQIHVAARLHRARLSGESLSLQKERAVLRFADGAPGPGAAIHLSA